MSLFDVPQEVLNARPPGAKDFDFLQGGCQTWYEFETPAANQLILGGFGNGLFRGHDQHNGILSW